VSEYNKSGAAMMLAKLGYSVVPLHHAVGSGCSCSKRQKCGSPGKHPRERGWKDKAAGADQLRQIDESWGKHPHANIGVCTGSRYGLIVLDFDFRHGASAVALDWCNQHPDWWQGAMIVVNDEQRGFHAYFRCQHEPITKGDIFPGVDVRGNGGCVVGVGSIHANGNTYKPWEVLADRCGGRYTNLRFSEQKPATPLPLDQLPMLPDFLVEATQERHKERLRKYSGTTQEKLNAKEKAAGGSELEQHREAVDDAIAETIPTRAGRRHTGVFHLARRLRHIFGEHAETEMLRKIVRVWQSAAEETAQAGKFELRGCFIDSWEEFLNAWQRVHTPSDGTDGNAAMIATMNRQLSTGPKPEAVAACLEELGYDDDALLSGLVLLLYQLQQRNPEQPFPCSARFAADCVNAAAGLKIGFQQYSKRLTLLCRDGVIVRTAQGTQSPKSAESAEYRWAWGDDGSAVVSAWTNAERIRAASKAGPPKTPALGPSPLRAKDRSKYRQPHLRPEWVYVMGVLLRYQKDFRSHETTKRQLAWKQLGHYRPVVNKCFQTRAFYDADPQKRNAMAAGFIAVLDAMTDQQ